MRKRFDPQLQFGAKDIAEVKIDLTSRDEISKILLGLQHIFMNKTVRDAIFEVMEEKIASKVSLENGRPGMFLWEILVLGTIKLICNTDYDHLQDYANNHETIRAMLGIPKNILYEEGKKFKLQTLKDNVGLLNPKLLAEINLIVIDTCYRLLGVNDEKINARADSVVVKTDVHFPTDISLLWDAIRVSLRTSIELCKSLGWSDIRKANYHMSKVKKAYNRIRKVIACRKSNRDELLMQEYKDYLKISLRIIKKLKDIINKVFDIKDLHFVADLLAKKTVMFLDYASHQVDLVVRRIFNDEKIPNKEKIHSVFEPYTEWICKGKINIKAELGVRVMIIEDQYQLILNHVVMFNKTDPEVAVDIVKNTKEVYKNLSSVSFDKGPWSKDNFEKLEEILDLVVLPKRGKLSKKDEERENSDEFKEARKQHPAVESAIHSLDCHGFDRCLDHGKEGFERHIALAILAHNIHRLGVFIQQKKLQKLKRKAA